MIDRIRQDIQERLDQLLGEAERLRQALTALGGGGQGASRQSRSETAGPSADSESTTRRPRASRSSSGTRRSASAGGTASAPRARAASGGTKNSVLKALTDANGQALTASEVAAATGLGRASVSTTLSKLARAGDVTKAERGYRLSGGSSENGSESTAAAGAAPATSAESAS